MHLAMHEFPQEYARIVEGLLKELEDVARGSSKPGKLTPFASRNIAEDRLDRCGLCPAQTLPCLWADVGFCTAISRQGFR
jgi:hypothetical protein